MDPCLERAKKARGLTGNYLPSITSLHRPPDKPVAATNGIPHRQPNRDRFTDWTFGNSQRRGILIDAPRDLDNPFDEAQLRRPQGSLFIIQHRLSTTTSKDMWQKNGRFHDSTMVCPAYRLPHPLEKVPQTSFSTFHLLSHSSLTRALLHPTL